MTGICLENTDGLKVNTHEFLWLKKNEPQVYKLPFGHRRWTNVTWPLICQPNFYNVITALAIRRIPPMGGAMTHFNVRPTLLCQPSSNVKLKVGPTLTQCWFCDRDCADHCRRWPNHNLLSGVTPGSRLALSRLINKQTKRQTNSGVLKNTGISNVNYGFVIIISCNVKWYFLCIFCMSGIALTWNEN